MTAYNYSPDEFKEIINQAKRDLKESDEIWARFQQTRRNHWENLAGPGIEGLLRDRNLALNYLHHLDRNHRVAALEILSHHWAPDSGFAALCEEMAFRDPDPEVRGVALLALCGFYQDSKDARVGRLVANIIRDQSESSKLRSTAYSALFRIAGARVETWPDPTRFRFPEDVNWVFVDSFLKEEKSLV